MDPMGYVSICFHIFPKIVQPISMSGLTSQRFRGTFHAPPGGDAGIGRADVASSAGAWRRAVCGTKATVRVSGHSYGAMVKQ